MLIEDVEFTLKDGRKAKLRNAVEGDIYPVIDFVNKIAAETIFLSTSPEDSEIYTYEFEKAFFERTNAADNESYILCTVEGKVVGSCNISWSKKIKLKHRASVGIGILKDYWNLGIGSRMFEELIKIAERNSDIAQIELEFMEGNDRGRALYEKMGFKIVSVHPNAVRLKNGTLLNQYLMIKEMKK